MILPILDELSAQRHAFVIALGIGGGPFHHCLGTDGTHPGIGDRSRHFMFVIVHIGKAGHSRSDHLGAGEQSPPAAEFGADELALHGQHVAEKPHIKPKVIGQTSQQAHRHVGVSVDQARQDRRTFAVNHVRGFPRSQDLVSRPDCHDVTPSYSNSALGDKIPKGVHGYHQPIDQ
jgi:hypothetical protein